MSASRPVEQADVDAVAQEGHVLLRHGDAFGSWPRRRGVLMKMSKTAGEEVRTRLARRPATRPHRGLDVGASSC